MATKSYSNIDKPVQLVELVTDNGDGSGSASGNTKVVGNVASGATDSGNPVKVGAVYTALLPTLTDGQRGNLSQGSRGSLRVELFAANSGNTPQFTASGSDGLSNSTISLLVTSWGNIFNGTSWDRLKKPNGVSRILSAAASTNATSAKASPGDLVKVVGKNEAAALRYLKFYNKASAPTVGTDTPVLTIPLPASVAFDLDLSGHYFSTGIAYALTTGVADADTGALTAADVLGLNISYT